MGTLFQLHCESSSSLQIRNSVWLPRHAVPIVSAGASFTVVVPAAFVTFPTTAMEALRPWPRSQIIAAGPFHNLVFWALLLLVDHLGTGDLLTRLLYRDISDLGRVVMHIDRVSLIRYIYESE